MSARAGAFSVGCAVAVVVLYVLAIRTGRGQDIDELARESRKLTELGVRRAGVVVLRLAVVTALPLAFVASLGRLARDGRWRTAVACIGASTLAVLTAEVLKATLTRPSISHPRWVDVVATYPSGHATYAMVVALTAVAATSRSPRGLVLWIAGAIALWALALTGSGWHRPSDVIAGFLTASAFFGFALALGGPDAGLAPDSPATTESGPTVSGPRWLRIGVIVAATALALAYYLPLDPGPGGLTLHLPVYVACSALAITTGVAVVLAHTRLRQGPATGVTQSP